MSSDLSSVRISRLNSLLVKVSARPGVSRAELMDALGYASARTFERDLEFLRDEFAVEIEYSAASRGYVLKGRGRFLVQLLLGEDEALALASGVRMAAHFLPHLGGAAESAWDKLSAFLPPESAQISREWGQSVALATPVSTCDSTVFPRLHMAIRAKSCVRIRYVSPYRVPSEEREYTLSPWGMYFREHSWYLWTGRSDKPTGQGFTFRLSRLRSVELCPELPYAEPPQGATLEGFAGSAWFAASGALRHAVTLKLFPPLAQIVAETPWHVTQRIEPQDDGSALFHVELPELTEMARWIMACAPCAQVIAPKELKARVAALAAEMSRLNADTPPETADAALAGYAPMKTAE